MCLHEGRCAMRSVAYYRTFIESKITQILFTICNSAAYFTLWKGDKKETGDETGDVKGCIYSRLHSSVFYYQFEKVED